MTDLNQEFYDTRSKQLGDTFEARLADGRLIALGNNRFRSNEGWDAGEVWTLDALQRMIPQHNLDMSTGKAALAYKKGVPIWHELGNPIPDDMTDIGDVLSLGGVNFNVIQRPSLFTTSQFTDLEYETDFFEVRQVPDSFVNLRDDTMTPLGTVGKVYEPFQNRDAMEFLQELTGEFNLEWESVGATREGRRVFVCVSVPDTIIVDPNGVNDEIKMFLAVVNSHDGTTPLMAMVTPWRIICGNTERFALRDAKYKWSTKHTRNAKMRVDEARRTLNLTLKYRQVLQEEENKLAQTEMLIKDFWQLVQDVYPRDRKNESKTKETRGNNREDALMDSFYRNKEQLGATGYAAERAFTEFYDNVAPRKLLGGTLAAARATAIIEDTDTEKKSQVHKLLLERAA